MSESQVDELTLWIGELEISVRRRSSTSGDGFTSEISLAGPRAAAAGSAAARERVESSPTGSSAWSVVGGSRQWSAEWKKALLEASTAAEILAVDLQCVEHLQRHLSAEVGAWTVRARLGRALRAGLAAKNKLEGVGTFERSPDIGVSNRIYVVLRGAPGVEPCICHSARAYYQAVRLPGASQLHARSVSHACPSRAEAVAYVLGAQALWPPERED